MKLSAFGWLQVIAIILKLTGYLPLSWWLVLLLLEIWILAVAVVLFSKLFLYLIETPEEKQNRRLREALHNYATALKR